MVGPQHDDVLGDFDWGNDEYCSGTVKFLGTATAWSLELDCRQAPDTQVFEAAIQASKKVLPRLTAKWELDSRKEAARQVMDAVYHQSEEDASPEQVQKLVDDMTIDSLDFLYTVGNAAATITLRHDSPKNFPTMKISVQFDENLEIDEVTIDR